METLIYTKDNDEYENFCRIIDEEDELSNTYRGSKNGHKYYDREYDIVVVSLEGAEGMEVAREYRKRYEDTLVIWITSDPFFAGTAMRENVYGFLEKPVSFEKFRETYRKALKDCKHKREWHSGK